MARISPRFYPMAIFKRIFFAYLIVCLAMWAFQRRLMYLPNPDILPPASYGLSDFKALTLEDLDGTHIQAWYKPAQKGFATIIYFHGNGGNMSWRGPYFRMLADKGFGLMAIDYRGYGGSEGSPSEEGFYQDARAAIDYSARAYGLHPSQLIFYGESIGTGVAVQMATEYTPAALVLQSPYISLVDRGVALYPWLPVRILTHDHFDSLSKIQNIHTPLLILHGEVDTIVPVTDGRRVYEAAPDPKQAVYFPEKGHTNMDLGKLRDALSNFMEKHPVAAPSAS